VEPLGVRKCFLKSLLVFALVACYFRITREYESRYYPCSVERLSGCLRYTGVARKTQSANLMNKKVVD
jgi:hypothetical protein